MELLKMNGPYDYDIPTLNKEITDKKSGDYALGHLDLKKIFIIEYVGRADSDVRGSLIEHMSSKYQNFKFSYTISRKASNLI